MRFCPVAILNAKLGVPAASLQSLNFRGVLESQIYTPERFQTLKILLKHIKHTYPS